MKYDYCAIDDLGILDARDRIIFFWNCWTFWRAKYPS